MQAFAYKKKDIHLSQKEYERWVIPQLKKIKKDYQKLISIMNPHLKGFKDVVDLYDKQADLTESLKISCQANQYTQECIDITNNFIVLIGKIIKLTKNFPTIPLEKLNTAKETTLKSYTRHNHYRQDLFDLYFDFISFKFFYTAKLENPFSAQILSRRLQESHFDYNILLLTNTDPRFHHSFTSFWSGYMKPLDFSILRSKNKTLFIRHINELNLRWNIFHAELTKRNKDVPNGTKPLLQIMHNRWNQSLKVTLR